MTTISFDGRYLAADGFTFRSNALVARDKTKITLHEGVAYAMTGAANWLAEWIVWAQNGSDPKWTPPHSLGDEGSSLIRIVPVGNRGLIAETCCWHLPYWGEDRAPTAWGSGMDFAIGAMDAGANAMEAVRIASARNTTTGGTIRFVDFEFYDRGVQVWDGAMPTTRFPMPLGKGAEANAESLLRPATVAPDLASPRPGGPWKPRGFA